MYHSTQIRSFRAFIYNYYFGFSIAAFLIDLNNSDITSYDLSHIRLYDVIKIFHKGRFIQSKSVKNNNQLI